MTRDEHLAWCKERALELLDAGELAESFNSMLSDLRKHPELENHAGAMLGLMQRMGGFLDSPHAMRRWITGFN